jgi:D-3-phosphoglycerate dehydrogenase
VIVRLFAIGRGDFEKAARLRVVAKHGVGVDNIDCVAATARGVPVLWTPGANSNAVAEHTLGLLLALARKLEDASRALKMGKPFVREEFEGVELAGRVLGVVGLGRIGSRVAQKAALGLGMRVLAHDPYVERAPHAGLVELCERLDDLLREADFLSLHVPLTDETRRMIDARALALLPAGARLVNTARGAVVDEAALVEALRSGRLAGAGLDVFEEEPLPASHPLASAPNVILTPHVAGMTREAMERVSEETAEGVLAVLQGRRPANVFNPEAYVFNPKAGGREGPGTPRS